VLKDLNFTDIAKAIGNKLIDLKPEECKDMTSILEADTKFL